MKRILKSVAAAASLVLAGTSFAASEQKSATTDPQGSSSTSSTSKGAAKGAGDTLLAKEYWEKNAKDGYLTKEQVARFKGADGKNVDMQKIDTDNDGRVSQREWNAYHQTAGAAGRSPTEGQPQK